MYNLINFKFNRFHRDGADTQNRARLQIKCALKLSRSNWNLEVLVFEERGKPKNPEKNLSEQGREPTTNSTQI